MIGPGPDLALDEAAGVVGHVHAGRVEQRLPLAAVLQVADAPSAASRSTASSSGRMTRWTRFNSRLLTSPGPVKLLEPTMAA